MYERSVLLAACLCGVVLLARVQPTAAEPEAKPATLAAPVAPVAPVAPAPKLDAKTFHVGLNELGLRKEQLAYADAASQTVRFKARTDHVLTGAEVDLSLARPMEIDDLKSIDLELNGDQVASIPAAELRPDAVSRHIVLDSAALSGTNTLTLRMRTKHDPNACGRVPLGSWNALSAMDVQLSSEQLPLPRDFKSLPLPFFDPEFDREQVLDFVLTDTQSAEQLRAAALVAGWFALQGRGRLAFRVHVGTLPSDDAIVIAGTPQAAAALGLTTITTTSDKSGASLDLLANPRASERMLLVLSASRAGELLDAARLLLRDGYSLRGDHAQADGTIVLPQLPDYSVPRWVAASGDVWLERLPDPQPLRLSGGHSGTLQLSFRLTPDLFVWPANAVDLELDYAQGVSPQRGPARVNVAWNGESVGTLPSNAKGHVSLPVPRHLLRGYNELLLQVSYDEPAQHDKTCASSDDAAAWIGLLPGSKLRLHDAKRFAWMPDLVLFLYDGFPFTAHGDLRNTSVVLPKDPQATEVAAMLDAFSHFAAITGAAPSGAEIVVGTPHTAALKNRDVLLIAHSARHPWLASLQGVAPLSLAAASGTVEYPKDATLLARWLVGRFGDDERQRAQAEVQAGPFGAVYGVAAPWDLTRNVVVLTASNAQQLPRLSAIAGYAEGHELRNDLMVINANGRFLFQIGVDHGRGQLPMWILSRAWLAHYWTLLLPSLLLAAVAFSLVARARLTALAKRRLREVTP